MEFHLLNYIALYSSKLCDNDIKAINGYLIIFMSLFRNLLQNIILKKF